MTFKIIQLQKINIYEKWLPLTTVKMVHGSPKKGGSVNITTPVIVFQNNAVTDLFKKEFIISHLYSMRRDNDRTWRPWSLRYGLCNTN